MTNTPQNADNDANPNEPNSAEIKMPIRQWPIPMDEAVEIVISHMDQKTKDIVANSEGKDWPEFHHNIGVWLRNAFGLWKVFGIGADHAWVAIFEAVRVKLRADKGIQGK